MKIASWNINSVRARLPLLLKWLQSEAPDVALLQEIKAVEAVFPYAELDEAGYIIEIAGQKGYNGVAILSKSPLEDLRYCLPGDDSDTAARYIEATVPFGRSMIRIVNIYAPNGNPVESDKYPYKLAWLERLQQHIRQLLDFEELLVIGGDYNVIPTDDDVAEPENWRDDALARPESRAAYRSLLHLGLTNAVKTCLPEPGHYSFWDYQGSAWPMNRGILIDHFLLSAQAADRLERAGIDREWRGQHKASDHVPVWCILNEEPPV